jgi:hypothetical protein
LTLPRRDESKLHCPDIDSAWAIAKPHIERALQRGSNYTIDDIYAGLKSTAMQLWMWGDEAALVTTIQNKDEQRWLLFLALGGENMTEWQQYLPIVEDWARENGCQEMRIYGRAGWKCLGFDIEYTKLVRKL